MNVKDLFLKYVSIASTSDENSETCPSTSGQLEIGKIIAEDMRSAGLSDVRIDENGYVYGFLPGAGTLKDAPAIGLIAHMDTSDGAPGENVIASIVKCTGEDICLSNGRTLIRAELFPELREKLVGEDLIVSDGNTLLGADDKAGVAEIIAACAYLKAEGADHRPLVIGITPDEEIGRGADKFDIANFGAEVAYTVDGGAIGEIEYENFNAASFRITVNGVNIHPGEAKNKMKNAILLANKFISMLPEAEIPAHTEGYEGFYHVASISGDENKCIVEGIIRDHDRKKFEQRKAFMKNLCAYLNGVYGENSIEAQIRDSYYNMKEKILPHMELIDAAREAFHKEGIEAVSKPIRGGTDGARLSYEGLPCPNLSTGGYGFHSCVEFIPVSSLEKMVKVLAHIAGA